MNARMDPDGSSTQRIRENLYVCTRFLTCIRINCIQNAFTHPSAVLTITTLPPTIPPNLTPLVFQMVTERQPAL
jgi:hypothetical protein